MQPYMWCAYRLADGTRLSVPVWVGAGDSRSGRRLGSNWLAGADVVAVPAIAAAAATSWPRRSSLRRPFSLVLAIIAWCHRHSFIVPQVLRK